MAEKSNLVEVEKKLYDLSKEELIELVTGTIKISKDAGVYVSVRLQGEVALQDWVTEAKELIYKEFNPTRGFPKMRIAKIKKVFTEVNKFGKMTIWPFELKVYFCEVVAEYIYYEGDIFESVGDYLTDTYEKLIKTLNKEKTPDLYEQYKVRLKAIANKPNCHCWGIHNSLACSYDALKWEEEDEDEEELEENRK